MKKILAAVALLLLVAPLVQAQKRQVTIDDVLDLKAVGSPVVSPDGTEVLYTVRQWEAERDRMESRTRVWKVPVDGGPERQMTFGERGDTQPQWSPDGRYISFVSARGAGTGDESPRAQLHVMRSGGGEAIKLTDAKEGVASYAWAPDSSRIAFVATEPRSSDQEDAIRRRKDERVPTGQAFELFRALKDRGKTTELVFCPREGHGIAEYYHQRDRLTRIVDWVMRFTLGPGKTTTQ